MKSWALGLAVVCALGASPAYAATLHLATDGSDAGAGTASDPFATWQHAIDAAGSGDTIKVAPGTYRPITENAAAWIFQKERLTILAYGATVDCSDVVPTNSSKTVFCVRAAEVTRLTIKGLAVTGAKQFYPDTIPIGLSAVDSANVLFKDVTSYGNEGVGILVGGDSSGVRLRGCKAHHNFHPLPNGTREPGGDSDGINIRPVAGTKGNSAVRCQTWKNGDDGLDLWDAESAVTVRSNQSWGNGVAPDGSPAGDGRGFKLGRNFTGPKHLVTKNQAWDNVVGFDTNGAAGPLVIKNNKAWCNDLEDYQIDPGVGHILKNNRSPNRRCCD